MYYKTNYSSPIGKIILACSDTGLIGLWFQGQKYECKTLPKENIEMMDNHPILLDTKKWLDAYFNKLRPKISELTLEPIGTDFQKSVWKKLTNIPYGEVVTYSDIAKEIAVGKGIKKMSAQAIGSAVAHNQISIIIPCHRVIGSNGSLTGYAGGIDKKIQLLNHEGMDTSRFLLPKK